eukprot:TRINITY_DN2802_c0_g1_i1.p1 TRINITY_DN2802_c0_g1~~TRINITY_DN2802_c0_g1_i1.p1  ORF type:complete len:358 (+),score=47.38 TRINITY_DN2802_c0_g1_i1:64-1137(+)
MQEDNEQSKPFQKVVEMYGTFGGEKEAQQQQHEKIDSKRACYGELCFVLSLLIFSQVPSVVQWLYRLNSEVFTACSILCASNMVGAIAFPLFFRAELSRERLRKVPFHEWVVLCVSAVLYSAIGPALQLTALRYTSVTTMAVTQRFESVNLVIYSWIFTSVVPSTWCKANTGLIVTCIFMYLSFAVSANPDESLKGPVYTVLSGWAYSTSLILTKRLEVMSVGQVAVGRAVMGTVFYHFMAVTLQNEESLSMIYSQELWTYMIWYGIVYVFLGQYFWTIALKECPPVTLSAGVTSLFPLQVFWSVVILGTAPTFPEKIVTAVLVVIVASCTAEILTHPPPTTPKPLATADKLYPKGM